MYTNRHEGKQRPKRTERIEGAKRYLLYLMISTRYICRVSWVQQLDRLCKYSCNVAAVCRSQSLMVSWQAVLIKLLKCSPHHPQDWKARKVKKDPKVSQEKWTTNDYDVMETLVAFYNAISCSFFQAWRAKKDRRVSKGTREKKVSVKRLFMSDRVMIGLQDIRIMSIDLLQEPKESRESKELRVCDACLP